MTKGSITKLITSYGSTWGRRTPDGQAREIFFNPRSLVDPSGFGEMVLGQEVEFDEEPDRANGTHAIRVQGSSLGPLPRR